MFFGWTEMMISNAVGGAETGAVDEGRWRGSAAVM